MIKCSQLTLGFIYIFPFCKVIKHHHNMWHLIFWTCYSQESSPLYIPTLSLGIKIFVEYNYKNPVIDIICYVSKSLVFHTTASSKMLMMLWNSRYYKHDSFMSKEGCKHITWTSERGRIYSSPFLQERK